MAEKKGSAVKKKETDLWKEKLVEPVDFGKYAKEVVDSEKIILFGESNTGKTRWYLKILEGLIEHGMKKEDILMCVVFPDRPTGIAKLASLIKSEYRECIKIFQINTYEELVSSTAQAEQLLKEHYKKTGKYGWLIVELLEDAWKSSQDYFCREAYGQSMGEFFSNMRDSMEKPGSPAYEAFSGPFGGPWPIIKFFHNYNWIDKIKRMPFNVLFTSELKREDNKDSMFADLKYRPAGEKDNIHRVDTIIYLSHKGNKFSQACYKLTGYSKVYSTVDITGKNGYKTHKDLLKRLEKAGLRTSKIEDIEKEAGIDFKEEPKKEEKESVKKNTTSSSPKKEATTEKKEEDIPPKKQENTSPSKAKKPKEESQKEDEWAF